MAIIQVVEVQGQLVVDSRLIAQELGIEHRAFIQTLKKYETMIEQRFGVITFEMDKPSEGSLGGRPEKYALLTEPQATVLMTLSKNTEQVVECKFKLVEAFEKAKELLKAKERLESLLGTETHLNPLKIAFYIDLIRRKSDGKQIFVEKPEFENLDIDKIDHNRKSLATFQTLRDFYLEIGDDKSFKEISRKFDLWLSKIF